MEIEQFIVTDSEHWLREGEDEEIKNRNLKIIPKTIPHTTASLNFKMRFKFTRKDKERYDCFIKLIDEKGEDVMKSDLCLLQVIIPAEKKSIVMSPETIRTPFTFPHAGDYRAILIIDDEERSIFNITVEECKNQ